MSDPALARMHGTDTEDPLELDPRRSNFVTIIGRKGSGKSELARAFWESYPFDRLCIDPTGDFNPGGEVERLSEPLPARFPTDPEGRRVSLRLVPDPGSPTYGDELDRAVGLAFHHPRKRSMLLIDETEEMGTAQQTRPGWARALKQGRHRNLTLVCAGIRPLNINPLVLSQADYVAMFHTPNPDDRKRVASSIGYEPRALDAAHEVLEEHEFLWWDARAHELIHCPPIPLGRRDRYRRRT